MTNGDQKDRSVIREAKQVDGRIVVRWADGHRSTYHPVWLRHARFFPAFPEKATGSEGFNRPDRPDQVTPASVEVTPGGSLRVAWSPDGSSMDYEAAWLRDHCCSSSERLRRRRPVVRWDASISQSPPQMPYDLACGSDTGRLDLYQQVLDYGFVFLRDVPPVPGKVAEVAGMFGLVRPSPYANDDGDLGVEDVRNDPRVKVGTTTSHFLAPHTDTCWRLSISGLVFLHCLKSHERGGESILVDGLEVARRLREADPEAFGVLSRVPVNFAASVNNGDEWRALGRIITCDAEGNAVGLRYNDRSVQQLDLPEDLIEPVYSAIASLETVLYDPALWLRRRLEPGDVMVLDNQRVLHGRTYFDPAAGERHLQTCAVERDVFHNNYRRLARSLGREDWNQVLPWGVC